MRAAERGAIVSGVGLSQVGRSTGRHSLDLTLEACLRAIEDAGLDRHDVDGLAGYPGAGYPVSYGGPLVPEVQDALRLELAWYRLELGGPGQLQAVLNAVAAVATGLARHVLVYLTATEASAQGTARRQPLGLHGERLSGVHEWGLPFGVRGSVHGVALMAERHAHVYGPPSSSAPSRSSSARTLRSTPTPSTATRSRSSSTSRARTISTPLCLYDCDAPADGGVAFVVSHRDFAPDCRTGRGIHAVGTAIRGRPSWDQWDDPRPRPRATPRRTLVALGARPADVDTAQLYDGFSFLTRLGSSRSGSARQGRAARSSREERASRATASCR